MTCKITSDESALVALKRIRYNTCTRPSWLADASGVSRSSIALYLNGQAKDIQLSTLIKLLTSMDCTLIVTDCPETVTRTILF